MEEKLNETSMRKAMENDQTIQHFESLESFWGKPGNGAPRNLVARENLMKNLHYMDPSMNVRAIAISI